MPLGSRIFFEGCIRDPYVDPDLETDPDFLEGLIRTIFHPDPHSATPCTEYGITMVLILDSYSEIGAHVRSNTLI